jgi:[acyl-carrier-protein] S-malonyltransferase
MGRDIWEASPAARAVFEEADRVLGYELSRLCFEGPEERLTETEHAQPAILTVSLACLAAAVERGAVRERPAFAAGHSLGEYTALVASAALSLEDGLRLVEQRGRLMAEAGRMNPGTMAAILGLQEQAVMEVCRQTGAEVCNLNLNNQTVIGGSPQAVAAAMEAARARGARNAVELRVSGAFHSSLMQPAAEGLAAAVDEASIREPAVPVVANSTAAAVTSSDAIRDELRRQVSSPVRWHESVKLMADTGVTSFLEFGPGRVLTGLVKRLAPAARLTNISSLADMAGAAGTEALPA